MFKILTFTNNKLTLTRFKLKWSNTATKLITARFLVFWFFQERFKYSPAALEWLDTNKLQRSEWLKKQNNRSAIGASRSSGSGEWTYKHECTLQQHLPLTWISPIESQRGISEYDSHFWLFWVFDEISPFCSVIRCCTMTSVILSL